MKSSKVATEGRGDPAGPWRVVPLSRGQRLDVRPEDVVQDGDFRLCRTYRAGGGYDQLPSRCETLLARPGHHLQFVVQLFGCTLDCPYCYVTREGVWGRPVEYSSDDLVRVFDDTPATIFHLMGGAPAIYLNRWPELLETLEHSRKPEWVFHSDFVLNEGVYDDGVLRTLARRDALFAVDIKGVSADEFSRNTRQRLNAKRVWRNIEAIMRSGIHHYYTFTNISEDNQTAFWAEFAVRFGDRAVGDHRAQSFSIDLIDYDALPFVDAIPWGRRTHD